MHQIAFLWFVFGSELPVVTYDFILPILHFVLQLTANCQQIHSINRRFRYQKKAATSTYTKPRPEKIFSMYQVHYSWYLFLDSVVVFVDVFGTCWFGGSIEKSSLGNSIDNCSFSCSFGIVGFFFGVVCFSTTMFCFSRPMDLPPDTNTFAFDTWFPCVVVFAWARGQPSSKQQVVTWRAPSRSFAHHKFRPTNQQQPPEI